MLSKVVDAELWHTRGSRSFLYRYCPFFVDLDEIDELNLKFWWFSILESDYLNSEQGKLKEKVCKICSLPMSGSKIFLVTSPRILGYVFNPVSFFLVFENNFFRFLVAEVNNTFKQRHRYLLENTLSSSSKFQGRHVKEFHVSPFIAREGTYNFEVDKGDESLFVKVELEGVISAGFNGKFLELGLRRGVFNQLLTMTRILRQAVNLKLKEKLPVYKKPVIKQGSQEFPSFLQRMMFKLLERFLVKLDRLYLVLHLPDGTTKIYGDSNNPKAELSILSWSFFTKVSIGGDIGFGEAYADGLFQTEDIEHLLTLLVQHKNFVQKDFSLATKVGGVFNKARHWFNRNSKEKAKSNISAHYDLSPEFYSSFLDETMSYSSGVFESPDVSLEEAQYRKLQLLCEDARLSSDDRVLEIGCGWGSFAVYAAQKYGCKIDAVTLSRRQYDYLKEVVQKKNLQNLVNPILSDYRDLRGEYDKVISVEMIEAVGKEFIGSYFRKISELLTPSGVAVIQAITMPERRYVKYVKRSDWIQKYIFPGGHIPSLALLVRQASSKGALVLDSTRNIRSSYALTLGCWKNRFNLAEEVEPKFSRTWNYYLSYCKVGFEQSMINTHQLSFVKSD